MAIVPLNDLSRIRPDEADGIARSIREVVISGHLLRGQKTRDLENEFSRMFSGRSVVAVSNGTDALTLALLALRLPSDARVAVAPNAGGYGTTAAHRIGLATTFVDIDPLTAQMDALDLHRLLSADSIVGAVIMTHLYGYCGEVEKVAEVCAEFGVPLIEDCAQSIGARLESGPAGTFGDLATLSFYPTKNLGAIGDAGAVVASTEELASRVRMLAQYGWGERYSVEVDRSFNSRIDELQAAVLLLRLGDLEGRNLRRREIVREYQESVSGNRRFVFSDNGRFVGHLAIMVTDSRASDTEFLRSHGIETSIHYPILDQHQSAWQSAQPRLTPNAEELSSRVLTLPCFPEMTPQEVKIVCDALRGLP